MDLINQFIENYQKRFNYYESAGRLAAQQLEATLQSAGIRAMVTSRTKNPIRLKSKIIQRNQKRAEPYKNIQEIYADIADLCGVRVSLYFPGDREKTDKLICQLFQISVIKKFPTQSKPPSYNKRFSGYWASHYRVNMKESLLNNRQQKYSSVRIEIQVASVLMHAWSEVEHDLVYKPLQGTLSDEELAILDELNGLVLSGEIALERLQSAGNLRIQSKSSSFNNQYDLASFLYNHLSSKYKKNEIEPRMGNIELLFKLLLRLKLTGVKEIEPVLKSLRIVKDKRTVSEQIADQLICGNEKRYQLYRELLVGKKKLDDRTEDAIDSFMKQWILLENELVKITVKLNPKARGIFSTNNLKRLHIFDNETLNRILVLRSMRNYLVHGIEVPEADYIRKQGDELQKILEHFPVKEIPEPL